MADGSTVTESLALRLAGDLHSKSPIELMQHARSLIPLVLRGDDPAVLAAAIKHAGQIDHRLQSSGVAKIDRNAAAELKLWSMRQLGRWLMRAKLRGGGPGSPSWTLETIGIDRSTSKRCRRLGQITEEDFRQRLRWTASKLEVLTFTALTGEGTAGMPNSANGPGPIANEPDRRRTTQPVSKAQGRNKRCVSVAAAELEELTGGLALLRALLLSDYHAVSAWRESSGRPIDASLSAVAIHDLVAQTLATAQRILGREAGAPSNMETEPDEPAS